MVFCYSAFAMSKYCTVCNIGKIIEASRRSPGAEWFLTLVSTSAVKPWNNRRFLRAPRTQIPHYDTKRQCEMEKTTFMGSTSPSTCLGKMISWNKREKIWPKRPSTLLPLSVMHYAGVWQFSWGGAGTFYGGWHFSWGVAHFSLPSGVRNLLFQRVTTGKPTRNQGTNTQASVQMPDKDVTAVKSNKTQWQQVGDETQKTRGVSTGTHQCYGRTPNRRVTADKPGTHRYERKTH